MSYGKLFFYEIATSTPKSVYLDIARTVVAGSVIQLDIDGRPASQYYLGYGDYTVKAYKFIGTDPLSTNPMDWAEDREWNEAGLIAPNLDLGAPIATCNTISDLRAITPLTGDIRQVLGYYTRGDMFVRTYQWSATDLNSDNLGTIIKNPSISTGSWLLQTEGDVIDCRIFGILPGLPLVYTSRIGAMVTAIEASTNNPQSIFFPRGVYHVTDYSQTINANVIFDKQAYFSNDTAGGNGYFLTIAGTYTIYKNEALRAPASTAPVYFKFNNNSLDQEINVRWYGAVLDGSTDDGVAFKAMVSNTITSNYKFVIDGLMKLTTLSANTIVMNPIIMRNTGRFYMNQTTYTIEFKQPCYIINENRVLSSKFYNPIFFCDSQGVFVNLNKFKFTNVDLYASFFALNNSTGTTGSLHQPLSQLSVSKGTNFYFDMPLAQFTASVDTYSAGKYNFIWKTGTLNAINSGTLVKLNNFVAPDMFCIATNKFQIFNNPVKASWFCGVGRTDQQNSDGFAGAVQATLGSGRLDLGGNQYNVSNSISLAPTYSNRLFVYNGDIVYNGDSNPLFNVTSGTIGDIMFSDMVYSSSSDAPFIMMTGSCATMKFNNFTGIQTGTNSRLVSISSSGNINKTFEITNSYLEVGEVTSLGGNVTAVRWNNNEIHMIGGTDLRGMRPVLSNNYLFGTGVLLVSCSYAAQITNNFFSELSLYIHSVNAVIDGVYNGNTFTSSNALLSDIHLIANEANTEFKGCILVGNSFTGSQASATEVITAHGTFKTAYADHSLQISGNQSDRLNNLYVPQTESSASLILNVPATHAANEAKLYYKSSFNNLYMFTLVGVSQAPKYMNIVLITNTTIAEEYGSVISMSDLVNDTGGEGSTFRFSDVGGTFAGGDVSVFATWKIY